ncbi:MAG TPA: FecR domain-containing protein [Bacteroidales bacterium]|nr:FecR domain-containing protein [Bacteroidales bacterium]
MTEYDQKIWEVISSVLNGSPSAVEQELFDSWLNESDVNRKFYETLQRSKHVVPEFTPKAKRRVYSKIESTIQSPRTARKIRLWTYAAVASVAVLLTVTFQWFFLSPSENRESYIVAQTPNGVKSKITLPDASIVYLNSGSTLRYPSVFRSKERKVSLKGEAYFEVRKDREHPFIVETGSVNIKVLGTHFNVKNYDEDPTIEASLLEGAVEVEKTKEGSDTNEKVKLMPNQQAVYNKISGRISKRNIDATLSAIWKEGKYYFEDEKFLNIASRLEHNFNVKIKISSEELKNRSFSGLLDKNRTIYQILDALKVYCNFHYDVKGDSIIIKN